MPKEETIQQIRIRNVIGEKEDLPKQNPRASLSSRIRTLLLRITGVPQLIHLYGALELNKTITLASGENYVRTIFSDGTYLYVGLDVGPGKIVKIDLSTFTTVSTLTLDGIEGNVYSLLSDGTYLYAGLYGTSSNGMVTKIDLRTFTKVSTITFAYNEKWAMTLSTDGTYLYAGSYTFNNPGKIIKIDLNTFTQVNTLTFAAGENGVTSLYLDENYLYAGLNTSPAKIVKIDLNTFTKISTLTLDSGENGGRSSFSDGTYLYIGLDVLSGKIVKIDLNTFTKISTLTLGGSFNAVYSIFSDGTYIYAGLADIPGKVAKINLSTFTHTGTIIFNTEENKAYSLYSDGTYLYTGFDTAPGKIVRRYIIPTSDLHKRKIDLIDEQTHTGTYYTYPPNAAGVTITSAAGAYTKGAYTEIIPVNTILTQYFITGVTLSNLTVNTDYVFDIATGLAASEVIVATVSHMTDNTNLAHECLFPVPIKISSNTRISARSSDQTGSLTSKAKIRYKT